MMSYWRWIGSSILLLGMLAWGSLGAWAEEKTALGVLDMGRLFSEYNEYQQANREYQDYQQRLATQFQARLNQRNQHFLLTRDEWDELETLLLKGNDLKDEEKKRLQELQAITPRLREELVKLQAKPDLTDAEKARKKELTDKQNASLQELQERRQEYDRLIQEKLRERDNEVSAKLRAKIDAMIVRIAQENHLDLVLSKDSVLYGGLDITDQVVNNLNKENPVPEAASEKGSQGAETKAER